MSTYKTGQLVGFKGRRGHVDCAIASIRRIQKGRRAGLLEYTLAPMIKTNKTYAHVVIGESLFCEPKQKWSEKEIKQAIAGMKGTDQEVHDRRQKKKQRGRDAIGDVDVKRSNNYWGVSGTKIGVGDEVLVNYTNTGPKWESVASINYESGKVGIRRRGLRGLTAISGKRNVRWIHPDAILNVRQQTKKIPFTITDRMLEEMTDVGWAQITFGSEFIERSYVIGFTKELALKGNTYDTPDHNIYQDPVLGLFWRDTGCFD